MILQMILHETQAELFLSSGKVMVVLHPSKKVMQHNFNQYYQFVYGIYIRHVGITWKLVYLSFYLVPYLFRLLHCNVHNGEYTRGNVKN